MWLCQIDYQILYLGVEEEPECRSKELPAARLLCLQTSRIRLSLLLHEAYKTSGQLTSAGIHIKQVALTCRRVTLLHRKSLAYTCTSFPQLASSRVNFTQASHSKLSSRKKIYCSFHVLKPGKPFLLKGNFISISGLYLYFNMRIYTLLRKLVTPKALHIYNSLRV